MLRCVRWALLFNPNQDVRLATQGDFECLLNSDGFKHTDSQIQRRSERYGRTPGFKGSNVNNHVTTDQSFFKRKTGDGRRSLILNQIDATRFRSVCLGQRWIKTGWILLKRRNMWPVVQPMSEPGEFVFVPRNLTVRDSVAQIGNNTSNSEALIQSRTALNAGEVENVATDQLEAVQQREHRDTREFPGTGTSSRRRCQYQEGREARECCNNTQNKANRCFCTTILFKLQDWYSTGHGSHTPLKDEGDKPMMDLAQSLQTLGVHALADLQTWCVRTQNWYEHVAASICADVQMKRN